MATGFILDLEATVCPVLRWGPKVKSIGRSATSGLTVLDRTVKNGSTRTAVSSPGPTPTEATLKYLRMGFEILMNLFLMNMETLSAKTTMAITRVKRNALSTL